MKTIKLPLGMQAIVSDEDHDRLNKMRWSLLVGPEDHFYAFHKKCGFMHRLVLKTALPLVVDHINRNTLDNRRENLRCVTPSRNCSNRLRKVPNGLPGIYMKKGKWVSRIRIEKKEKHLGFFLSKEKAAQAYRMAYLAAFGEEHPFYRS